MKKVKVVVKQNEEKPVPVEVIADSIKSISEGIKKLRSGPLNDKALMLLIQHAAPTKGSYSYQKITIGEIKAVLDGIEGLEEFYLKKKTK